MHVARLVSEDVAEAWTLDAGYDVNPVFGRRLAAALADVDLGAIAAIDDARRLIRPLMDSIVSAMYWQPPWTHEGVIGSEPVLSALEPVASALAQARGTWWWDFGVDRLSQQHVRWIQHPEEDAPADRPPALPEILDLAVVAESRTGLTQAWWSVPNWFALQSARALDGLPASLCLVEECTGDFEQAWVWGVEVDPHARVREITAAADWVALVAEYPVVLDGHDDWRKATGRTGGWTVPDWRAVSEDWDGVHLTVSGYLAAASQVLDLGNGTATMIAGFNPDHTFWLRDVVRVSPQPVRWVEREVGEDYVWSPA